MLELESVIKKLLPIENHIKKDSASRQSQNKSLIQVPSVMTSWNYLSTDNQQKLLTQTL